METVDLSWWCINTGSSVITNEPYQYKMQVIGEIVWKLGYLEFSVLYGKFFYKPKTALRNVY